MPDLVWITPSVDVIEDCNSQEISFRLLDKSSLGTKLWVLNHFALFIELWEDALLNRFTFVVSFSLFSNINNSN